MSPEGYLIMSGIGDATARLPRFANKFGNDLWRYVGRVSHHGAKSGDSEAIREPDGG